MQDPILMVANAVNTNKGAQIGAQALLLALIKSLPREQRIAVLSAFDQEVAIIRSTLEGPSFDRELSVGFESFVSGLEDQLGGFDQH